MGLRSPRMAEKEEYKQIIDRNAGGPRHSTIGVHTLERPDGPRPKEPYRPPAPTPVRGVSEPSEELFPAAAGQADDAADDDDDIAGFYARSKLFGKAFAAAKLHSLAGQGGAGIDNSDLKERLL